MGGKNRSRRNIDSMSVTAILLNVIVLLSFLVHLFAYTLTTSAYVTVLMIFSLAYAFVRPKINIEKNRYSFIWLVSICIAVVSLLFSGRSANSIVDVSTLFCGMLIALFHSRKNTDYVSAIRLIYLVSLFFAFGVIVQLFAPSIYYLLLNVFPSKYAAAIRVGADELIISDKRGFTTNTGTAASYLCSGIMAGVSLVELSSKSRNKYLIAVGTLVLALLFTGKRGPAFFIVLSLLLRYILPERRTKKMKKYWNVFLAVIIITVLYSIFGSALSFIPFVREIAETFNGIVAGDDISNLRLSLYAWALTLFKQHPITGIGWGDYRYTVIGNISRKKALDVHNIYLQLLCETGIIGFLVFMVLFASFWIYTKNAYCQCYRNEKKHRSNWLSLLSFSFSFQSFFLLYGLTGNVLYDQHFQILYALSCGITLAFMRYQHDKNRWNEKQ